MTGLVVIDYIITGVHRESGLEISDRFGEMVLRMVRDREGVTVSEYEESGEGQQQLNSNANNNDGVKRFEVEKKGARTKGNVNLSLKYI